VLIANPKQDKKHPTPLNYLIIILLTLFITETIVMILLHFILERDNPVYINLLETFTDSTIITLIILPILYYLMYKPLKKQISDHHNIQTDLSEKSLYLDSILKSSVNMAIAAVDLDFKIKYYNPAAEKLFGHTAEEVIGKTVMEMHTKENIAQGRFDNAIKIVKEKGIYEYTLTLKKNDVIQYIESTISGIWDFNNNLIGYVLRSIDITERKNWEIALQESEKTLNKAQEIAHIGSWEYNVNSGLITWSDQMYCIFGMLKDSLQVNFDHILNRIHPSDKDKVINAARKSFFEGKKGEIEFRIILEDKSERIVHADGELIFSQNGVPLKIIGTVQDKTESRKLQEKLLLMAHFAEENPAPILRFDKNKNVLMSNLAAKNILYIKSNNNTKLESILPAIKDIKIDLNTLIDNGEIYEFTTQVKDQFFYFAIKGVPRWNVAHLYGTNITQRKKAEEKLQLAANVFKDTIDGIVITDIQGNIQSVNAAFCNITGYTSEEVIGKNPNILKSGKHDNNFYKKMWKSLLTSGFWKGEIWNKRKNGSIYPEWLNISSIKNDNGEIVNYVSVFSDISDIKRAEQRYIHMAYHDSLTSLPNRLSFYDTLKQEIQKAKLSNSRLALLFFDLDRFKVINDTLGHTIGDLVILELAERIRKMIRENSFLARWGGDEFTIIIPNFNELSEISQFAQKILDNLSRVYKVEGHEFFLTVSIGIAVYPNDGNDDETLFKNADKAMFYAKEEGKNNYQFYSKTADKTSIERFSIEAKLHRALDNNEFFLKFQPQIDIKTSAIIGVEALTYWKTENKIISPMQFIPIAEESGIIIKLGDWVLRTACAQNKSWQNQGLTPIVMAVNISGRQFLQKSLVESVKRALDDTGLDPMYLELELTESILMHDIEKVISILNDLKDMGIKISIDDFGTGYSSLSYLKRFPIDKLKIDQSFTKNIPSSDDNSAISTAIVAMGHSLKMQVIAEGVETRDQFDFLKSNNCDEVQGFFFSKPVNEEIFASLLKKNW